MSQLYHVFLDQAQKFPDKVALVTAEQRFSYAEILRISDCWAAYLFTLPVGRPRVALLVEDPLHSICVSLAVARLDGACIPTNPQMMKGQLFGGWQACDVNVVVYEPEFAQKLEACNQAGMTFISTSAFSGDWYEANRDNLPVTFLWSDQLDFLITLSSGSTGDPKPIVLSQRVKWLRAKQTCDLYDLSADDIVLCASPFFHSLGQRLVFVPLLSGATLVHLRQFTPKKWLSSVEMYRVSFVIAVSTHLYALRRYLLESSDQLRSLQTIVTSSAPIDSHFKEKLFQTMGCSFYEIYGATEVAIVSNLAPADAREKYTTVGLPCKGVEIRIVNDKGDELKQGEVGEIAVKSPLAFEGYYNQSKLTSDLQRDGYFFTGDLGKIDTNGFLSYVSRKKDVIISGGINIYPGDIEKVLAQQSDQIVVAVIGVEDELLGEVVVAICSTEGNIDIESELRSLANQQLAAFQRPLKYFFTKQLPLTPSGKVAKQVLRERYKGGNDGWTLPLRIMLYGE